MVHQSVRERLQLPAEVPPPSEPRRGAHGGVGEKPGRPWSLRAVVRRVEVSPYPSCEESHPVVVGPFDSRRRNLVCGDLRSGFGSSDAVLDLNAGGVVDGEDVQLFKDLASGTASQLSSLDELIGSALSREASADRDFIDSEFILLGGSEDKCEKLRDFYLNYTKCRTDNFLITDKSSAAVITGEVATSARVALTTPVPKVIVPPKSEILAVLTFDKEIPPLVDP
mgnify:CR=1 FL=1